MVDVVRFDSLSSLVRAHGVSVDKQSTLRVGNHEYARVQIKVRDNEHAIAILGDMAVFYSLTDEVKEHARRITREHTNPVAVATAIQGWVKRHIAFELEADEAFRSPMLTVNLGAGDCDDHALLVAALARARGVASRVVGVRAPNGKLGHVAAQVKLSSPEQRQLDGLPPAPWTWCETTVDAHLGEEPFAAVKRLKEVRPDVTG